MFNRLTAIVLLGGLLLTSPPMANGASEAAQRTIAVYVVENQALTRDRLSIPETIVDAELIHRGYRVVPSSVVQRLSQTLPQDVAGVWNADKRVPFQQQLRADLLWIATVEYKLATSEGSDKVTGTVSVVARAFDTATGESLWFSQASDHPMAGATAAEAARLALAEVLPPMIADFNRAPEVRAGTPSKRSPIVSPKGTPTIRPPYDLKGEREPLPTSGAIPRIPSRQSYTGVIIEADHLPLRPSFRTGIYSQQGSRIYGPESYRMRWSENPSVARQQAGPNPLVLRAQSGDRGRIVLRENDARTLQREKSLLDRGRVTVVVRPPR